MVYYSIVFYIKQNKEKNKPEMLRNETTRRMSYRPSANTIIIHYYYTSQKKCRCAHYCCVVWELKLKKLG